MYHCLKKLSDENPVVGIYRKNIESLKHDRLPDEPLTPESASDTLKRLLPTKDRCQHFMHLYFKHFEGIYRILHTKTFWGQFEKLWSGELASPSSFTAVLLAAMSCARCLYPDERMSFEGYCSGAAIEAGRWVQAAEAFHSQQSQKHTTITSFQLPCLLLLSKRINDIKVKRHFLLSQTLIATAISAGFHRSPSVLGQRATIYEQEMRRRLWATMTELEFSCSINWGVSTFSSTLFVDCEPPSNLDDDDFDENTTEYPQPRPDNEFTACSFQRFIHGIKELRDSVSILTNNPDRHHAINYAEVLSYHQLIANKFAAVQSQLLRDSSEVPQSTIFLLKMAMELQLHQLLIVLHVPLAFGASSDVNKNHARFVCTESSNAIISIYKQMSSHGLSQLSIQKSDLLRASLCVCLLRTKSVIKGETRRLRVWAVLC